MMMISEYHRIHDQGGFSTSTHDTTRGGEGRGVY